MALLYKYVTAKGCRDILENRRLKAADPTQFNDPFELIPGFVGYPSVARIKTEHSERFKAFKSSQEQKIHINNIKQSYKNGDIPRGLYQKLLFAFSNDYRILCFAELNNKNNDILLWAHYADAHKGIRILFDVNPSRFFDFNPMSYYSKRVAINVKTEFYNDDVVLSKMLKAERTKARCWEYEKEQRAVVLMDDVEKDKNESYISLDKFDIKIKEVTFGCRFFEEKANSKQCVRKIKSSLSLERYKNVILKRAYIHKSRYQFDYNKPFSWPK